MSVGTIPATRARTKRPEEALQKQVAAFLDAVLSDGVVWWHTPNGGKRNKREAAKFKEMGVKAGVPDITIISGHEFPGRAYHIELKVGRNPTTGPQDKIHAILEHGAKSPVVVCRSLDEVQEALDEWAIPTRGRAA